MCPPCCLLLWHKLIREDKGFSCKVLPAFRPDKAINIDKAGFKAYLEALGAASGIQVKDFNSLKQALDQRLEFFLSMGCRAADHGLDFIPWEPDTDAAASFSKALQGEKLSARLAWLRLPGSRCQRMAITHSAWAASAAGKPP